MADADGSNGGKNPKSGMRILTPDSYQAVNTPGDLLPAVSGDGSESVRDQDERAARPQIVHRPSEIIDDRYVLTRPIDEGGMGVVWLAHSLQLKVDVAVKLANTRRSGTAAERMAREARAVAKLTHPAVVRIYDFGKTRHEDPYIAMELLRGETLGQRLDRLGPLDPIQAVQLLMPIVDALSTAHDCGIVHRDLKPDNIFLSRAFGRIYPKLLDFSLVKLVSPGFAFSTLTRDRRGLGTAPYLSPEQVKGANSVDRRTDVWSLCAVLYRATTGRAPFAGAGHYEVMHAVVEAKPTPTSELGVGDGELWKIIQRGLEKDPRDRYESMILLGQDLATWLLHQGVTEDAGHVALRSMWLPEADDEQEPAPAAARLGNAARLALVALVGVAIGVAATVWLLGP
jgi:serine/threonine-protein kinase